MRRVCLRLLVAVLAFSCGVRLHAARVAFSKMLYSSPHIEKVSLPSDKFEGTGIFFAFMEDYRRPSDGEIVRYGCFEQTSALDSLKLVRVANPDGLVERTTVLDEHGVKIGERVATVSAVIEWNEGPRFFSIIASSLRVAKEFESSRVWNAGCWNFLQINHRRSDAASESQ